MPQHTYSTYEQILQRMMSLVVARSDLNDITDSSSWKHLLAAGAREIEEVNYAMVLMRDLFAIDTAEGDDLDERAKEILPGYIDRAQATKAVGSVTFSRSGTSGTVNIPTGTVVKTPSGVEFVTTEAASLPDGFSSVADVNVVARESGGVGNVDAGTVIKFGSKPTGVDSVTNPAKFSQGNDRESDDAFRARIRDHVRTLARGTVAALEFAARSVVLDTGQQVAFAKAVEDVIERGNVALYVDDGSGTAESTAVAPSEVVTEGLGGPNPDTAVGGEEYLYLNNKPVKRAAGFTITSNGSAGYAVGRGVLVEGVDYLLNEASGQLFFLTPLVAGEQIVAAYTYFTGLLAEVQKVIDGDASDRATYPGWRAAGVFVIVATPQILQQVVEATLVLEEGFSRAAVEAEVRSAVSEYVNNLGISGDVIRNEVIERIMGVDGVYNLSLAQPANDVILLDDQLPRITAGNILLT